MFILDNTVLPTDGIDRFIENSRGAYLFRTDAPRANEEPQFYTANSQAGYGRATPATFTTVIEDNPIPTNSIIYEFKGLITPSSFTEAPTIFYLDNGKYFYDYIDASTYIVVDSSTPSVSASFTQEYSYFDFELLESGTDIFLTLDVSNELFDFSDISAVNIGGLIYTKTLISTTNVNEFYYDSTAQTLTIHANVACGPTQNVAVDLTFEITENESIGVNNVVRFDFSASNLDYIDYVAHQNVKYYPSAEITSGTLIYNRLDKVALCLL